MKLKISIYSTKMNMRNEKATYNILLLIYQCNPDKIRREKKNLQVQLLHGWSLQ